MIKILYLCKVNLTKKINMTKNAINDLKKWYDGEIPYAQREHYRTRIMKLCIPNKEPRLQLATFSNWLKGTARVPELAKPIIEKIAGKKIFNQ
jgi:hypothetical protein